MKVVGKMAGTGKKYPDLRFMFMRGLLNHETEQRTRHYLKSAAECTSKAIVSLELSPDPVKSVEQGRALEGIGGETYKRLKKILNDKSFSNLRPFGGKFVSSAGAILVALLELTEETLSKGHSPGKAVLISEERVRNRAVPLSEEEFRDNDNNEDMFCMAWWRLEVLIKRDLVKRRSLKKSPVLQLLDLGKEAAHRLRGDDRIFLPLINPLPSSHTNASFQPKSHSKQSLPGTSTSVQNNVQNTQSVRPDLPCLTVAIPLETLQLLRGQGDKSDLVKEDALLTNDTGADGLIMLVDLQEMGGERVGLRQLCDMLGQEGIRYKTRRLPTGDYSWVWRVGREEKVLPCLVERKRADDVGCTLKEGRFWNQINKMKAWKKTFTECNVDSTLHYIIERRPEEYVGRCADGCQGVGGCNNPTLAQVKCAITDLMSISEINIQETDNLHATVILLAAITAELQARVLKGDFNALLAENFSERKISDQVEQKHDQLTDPGLETLHSPLTQPTITTAPDLKLNSQNKNNTNIDHVFCDDVDTKFDEDLARAIAASQQMINQVSNGVDRHSNNISSSSLSEKKSKQSAPMEQQDCSDDSCHHCCYTCDQTPNVVKSEFHTDVKDNPKEKRKRDSRSCNIPVHTELDEATPSKLPFGCKIDSTPRGCWTTPTVKSTMKRQEETKSVNLDSSDEEKDLYQFKAKFVKLNFSPSSSFTEQVFDSQIKTTSKKSGSLFGKKRHERFRKKVSTKTDTDLVNEQNSEDSRLKDSDLCFPGSSSPVDSHNYGNLSDCSSPESLPDIFRADPNTANCTNQGQEGFTIKIENTEEDKGSWTSTGLANSEEDLKMDEGVSFTNQSNLKIDLQKKVDTVLTILSQLNRTRVAQVLINCGGNVEQCVSVLLDQTSAGVMSPANSPIDLTESQEF